MSQAGAQAEFTDVARTLVSIQNLIQPFGIIRGGIDDFSVLQFKADVFKGDPLID